MRYLGLDLGTKSLGLAISDKTGTIASSLVVLHHDDDFNSLIEDLKKIIKEKEVDKLVLGLPKNMNGTIGERGEYILKFKELLIKYNILNKTLVFGSSIYKDEFPNYYEIRDQTTSDEIDFLWSELSVLLYFQDFDIKDYDALLETLGVNI